MLEVFGYELYVKSPLLGSTWTQRSTYRLHIENNGLVTHELETSSDAVGSPIASRSSGGLYSSSYDQHDVIQSSYERKKCTSGGEEALEHLKFDEITADAMSCYFLLMRDV